MALTLNKTLSDEYANSYIDVAYADDYWASHFSSTKAAQWAALSTDQKTNLLIEACRVIETARFTENVRLQNASYPLIYDRRRRVVLQINQDLLPVKFYYLQRLQFPRNLDRDVTTGNTYIPEPLMMAQAEQTVYTLNYDDTAAANRMSGVTQDSITVGNIRLHQTYVADASMWSPMALEYARPFMLKTSHQLRRQ